MTKAERRLAAEGETDLVVTIRRKFQTTMREDLVGGVELLTGRKVPVVEATGDDGTAATG